MPEFGKRSRDRLETCHQHLQQLFLEVVKRRDCTVLCGVRTKEAQEDAFRSGHSRVQWPNSRHNVRHDYELSHAIDVAPWYGQSPHVRWKDTRGFDVFAGFVLGVASELGIGIRWGGDWDSDCDMTDQTFNDLVHFELKE